MLPVSCLGLQGSSVLSLALPVTDGKKRDATAMSHATSHFCALWWMDTISQFFAFGFCSKLHPYAS